jgi:hypothetical protein
VLICLDRIYRQSTLSHLPWAWENIKLGVLQDSHKQLFFYFGYAKGFNDFITKNLLLWLRLREEWLDIADVWAFLCCLPKLAWDLWHEMGGARLTVRDRESPS